MDTSARSRDGTRLVVRRLGAGIPVVLLHGSGGGLHSWRPVAQLLADRYELWLVCRRGYAPSDVPQRPRGARRSGAGPRRRGRLAARLEAMVADDGLGRWSAVELPTLLLQGADTWAPMPATMDRLAAVLPRIERLVWPAQMHLRPAPHRISSPAR